MKQQPFEVAPFRVGQICGVIRAWSQDLKQPCRHAGVPYGSKDYLLEQKLVDIIGTGKRGKYSTFPETFDGPQVDILVSPCSFHLILF